MSPDQKAKLVEFLQKNNNHLIGMCGDGANDCKALKTADVGLSLSAAESSIAAPFTSQVQNIAPIIELLREGKWSLATSFEVVKFIWLYAMIEYSITVILYYLVSDMSTMQYCYIDLFILIPLCFSLSRTEANDKLAKSAPEQFLFSPTILFSIILQILVALGFQLLVLKAAMTQSWFVHMTPNAQYNWNCYENTVLFLFTITQFPFIAIIFHTSKPFKKSIWTNYILVASLVFLAFVTYFLILQDIQWIMEFLVLLSIPIEFKFFIILMSLVNFAVSYLIEVVIEWAFNAPKV